uniref:Uncharacterized protein n=1 Tax=Myoviridae sp. ct0Tg8 TaxID=2826598 RepID=A0A8S5NBP2_9CAUD|nr:MAG TPA: hypothetical protein [Myoviridae sp. ct0Tg8]
MGLGGATGAWWATGPCWAFLSLSKPLERD